MISNNVFLSLFSLAVICYAVTPATACDFPYEETETISRELSFDEVENNRVLLVDNFSGFIHVEGYAGKTVIIQGDRIIRARNEKLLATARNEVELDIVETGDAIKLYVDGPFRKEDGKINYRGAEYYGYENVFNLTLKIPGKTNYRLSTVNGGDITVNGTVGDFDVKNINGSVLMNAIDGSGRIYALNGRATLEFLRNPAAPCYFGSLNGKVRVEFQQDLNADLFFKTFNGEILTDFEVSEMPASVWAQRIQPKVEKNGNKRVYKSASPNGVRIGSGASRV
jgi:hypothetical protein